jgi:Na+/H+-translocating membrane pyrophosphatase
MYCGAGIALAALGLLSNSCTLLMLAAYETVIAAAGGLADTAQPSRTREMAGSILTTLLLS